MRILILIALLSTQAFAQYGYNDGFQRELDRQRQQLQQQQMEQMQMRMEAERAQENWNYQNAQLQRNCYRDAIGTIRCY